MVKHPRHYPWSSYRANALGETDALITPHELYWVLGNHPHQRQTAYQEMFHTHIEPETLAEIRQTTQKGWALGNDRFKDEIERILDLRTRPLPKGGDRRSVAFKEQDD